MSKTSPFRPWNQLRLQWKLGLAFLAMAPLIAAAGGGGLYFINQIGASVDQIDSVAQPLASGANSHHRAGRWRPCRIGCAERAGRPGRRRAGDQRHRGGREARDRNSRISRILATANGLDIDVRGAKLSVDTFFANGRQAIAALGREAELAAESTSKFAEFEGDLDKIAENAGKLSAQSDALMSSNEDGSRTLIQSGSASVSDLERILATTLTDTYPVVRGAYRLQNYVERLRGVAREYLAATRPEELPALEQEFEKIWKSANEGQKRLSRRTEADVAELVRTIGTELQEVLQGARGEQGFFAAHAGALAASIRAAEVSKEMADISDSVRSSLSKVMARADQINDEVNTAAHDLASTALGSTAVMLLIGVVLSILYGAFTARGIARPLAQMAGVMGQLAGGDEDAQIPALGRGDEIGDMARSLTTIRDTGVRAARIQTALENTASVVLMADLEGKIIYANQAALRYFREQEGEIRVKLPEFQAGELTGVNAASFFGDAGAMTARLGELSESYNERVRFGGRTVDLTANPVMNESGGRLGTVVEWVDVTDQLKVEAEIVEGVTSIKAATAQLTTGSQRPLGAHGRAGGEPRGDGGGDPPALGDGQAERRQRAAGQSAGHGGAPGGRRRRRGRRLRR